MILHGSILSYCSTVPSIAVFLTPFALIAHSLNPKGGNNRAHMTHFSFACCIIETFVIFEFADNRLW